jgi:hypothetical protein
MSYVESTAVEVVFTDSHDPATHCSSRTRAPPGAANAPDTVTLLPTRTAGGDKEADSGRTVTDTAGLAVASADVPSSPKRNRKTVEVSGATEVPTAPPASVTSEAAGTHEPSAARLSSCTDAPETPDPVAASVSRPVSALAERNPTEAGDADRDSDVGEPATNSTGRGSPSTTDDAAGDAAMPTSASTAPDAATLMRLGSVTSLPTRSAPPITVDQSVHPSSVVAAGARVNTVRVTRIVECDCGWSFSGEVGDCVREVQEHGRAVHNMEVSEEQALAMAKPV